MSFIAKVVTKIFNSIKPDLTSFILLILFSVLSFFLMINLWPMAAWFAFIPVFYVILNSNYNRTFQIIFISVVAFLAPTIATFWVTFFAKKVYLVTSILLWIFFLLFFLLLFWLQKYFKSIPLKIISMIAGILFYIYFLSFFKILYIVELSGHVSLFGIAHFLKSIPLTILVFCINLLIAAGFLIKKRKNQIAVFTAIAGIVVSLYIVDRNLVQPTNSRDRKFEIVVVQGNYHKTWKWRRKNNKQILSYYEKTTLKACSHSTEKIRIIVWPEYAIVSDMIKRNPEDLKRLKELAKKTHAYLVTGTFVHAYDRENYDTALVLSPEGELIARYDSVLPFFYNQHTVAGDEIITVNIGGEEFGFVICYEELMPEMFEEFKRSHVRYVFSLVNDMEIDHSPGMEFVFRFARLRAAENDMVILRSANTGYSAVIDNFGQIVADMPPYSQNYFVTEISLH